MTGRQIRETHSVAAGLDYPGVGPELSYLRDRGRVEFTSATDEEAIRGIQMLAEIEGIIPALESAHAIAAVKAPRPASRKRPDGDCESVGPWRQGHDDSGGLSGSEAIGGSSVQKFKSSRCSEPDLSTIVALKFEL